MKNLLLLLTFSLTTSIVSAQSWGQETNFLYTSFWYDKYPTNIAGFRAATVEKWSNNAWGNSYRLTIPQLDAKNAPLSIETSVWNKTTNLFVRSNRTNTINNANGKPLSLRTQSFVAGSQTWTDSYRDTFSYAANGNLLLRTSLSIQPFGFDPVERDSFVYENTVLKKKFHELTAILVATGERVWGADQRDSFVFDASNRMIAWHQDPWVGARFATLQKHDLTYDANGRRASINRLGFNGTTWDTLFRYEYAYNAQGQLTEMVRKQRLPTMYANHTRFTFIYNANGLVQQELMESNISGVWTNNTRVTYSYTPLSTDKLFLSEDVAQIYPNPSTQSADLVISLTDNSLKLKNVKFFDINGKLIDMKYEIQNNQMVVKTQNLNKGFYIIHLEMNDGRYLTKKWTVF